MPGPLVAMAGASLVGGLAQASAARRAANAQTQASREQLDLQREMYDDQTRRFAPFLEGGTNALGAYNYELGLGQRPDDWQGLSMTPGAQFALREGRDTVESGAAMRGGLNSGATLAGLERLRMGMASQDRDNQLNRLAGLVDMGQGAAGMQAQAGNAFASMGSQSLANQGNARAAGAIGVGNALSGTMNNLAGVFGYQQQMAQPQAQPGHWQAPTARGIW
jgi:hypothetical protein